MLSGWISEERRQVLLHKYTFIMIKRFLQCYYTHTPFNHHLTSHSYSYSARYYEITIIKYYIIIHFHNYFFFKCSTTLHTY